ncbi:MAG: M16 family metallopeptidase [Anaerovoracaceae bacterium]
MIEIRKLNCGLRMVLEKIPYVESVTAGIWVKAGSVNEDDSCRGISHFIEHMMFKGTGARSARQIASDIDALGAQINAFTSKESTCYYVRSLSSNLDQACDILIDMMTDSLFDPEEMKKEKQVVKEEIKMVEDTPEDDAQDMLYEVLFKGEPLSGSILGTPESLDAFTHDDLKNYIAREYSLDHIVVSIAGNFDEEAVCAQFENRLSCMTAVKQEQGAESGIYVPSFKGKVKDIEQTHICLGTRALAFDHRDSYVLNILNNIMGGSMSSRLFQNIREEKGMAYTVYSYTGAHDRDGFYAISAGVAHEKIEDTVAAIREELDTLAAKGVTEEELAISKQQTKGGLIFSLENTSNRMVVNGKYALFRNRVRTAEEAIHAIDSITMEDIQRVAAVITDTSRYSGTIVSRRDIDLASLMK